MLFLKLTLLSWKIVTCEGNTAVLTCGFRRIRIISANYGRTDSITCSSGRPPSQLSNTNCYSFSSLYNVVVRCKGRYSCQVPATNSVFSDPCFGTYKYLKVAYICVQTIQSTQPGDSVTTEFFHTVITVRLFRPLLAAGDLARPLRLDECFRRIRIISANYGRTDSTICSSGRPPSQLSNTNCYSSSSLYNVVVRCELQHTCQVPATNSVFSDPCVDTYKYLKVVYICTREIVTCEGNTAVLTCGVLRIRIIRANYGRTDSTTCSSGQPPSQLSNTNCYSYNTLSLFCCRCELQQTCQVPATNSVFSDPCVGTYKYLKVVYICV
ncbi:L-rhamnose-binding lectin CSL3 [Ictalurus punctatus]|uniref:L-rhamnose-binding lectin CSL3 n=1 Tax=Ictalurus punctatus TaxID=7998 RepID=A0A9F7TKR6_ICTPU|nr:L-rhamnose-binding lectin CSL3 [Ictalurus punctatus]